MTENPVQNVTFPSNGGTAHGYLAVPESGTGPGLVVIQEWWGLTTHVKDVRTGSSPRARRPGPRPVRRRHDP